MSFLLLLGIYLGMCAVIGFGRVNGAIKGGVDAFVELAASSDPKPRKLSGPKERKRLESSGERRCRCGKAHDVERKEHGALIECPCGLDLVVVIDDGVELVPFFEEVCG